MATNYKAPKRALFKGDFFIPIPGSFFNHVQDGQVTLNMWTVYMVILRQVDFETGIWLGTAFQIHAALGGQMHLRTVQNNLQSLCEQGYLRSFHVRNERGGYPILVNRYPIRFGSLAGCRLNAAATTDARHPIYERDCESVGEPNRPENEKDSKANHESTANPPRKHPESNRESTVSPGLTSSIYPDVLDDKEKEREKSDALPFF